MGIAEGGDFSKNVDTKYQSQNSVKSFIRSTFASHYATGLIFIFAVLFAYMIIIIEYCNTNNRIMSNWDDKAKRLLKSELVKRGVSNTDLVMLLNEIGIEETKAGIDSKISRGSFSATFLLQCLTVIGCQKIEIEDYESQLLMVAEPNEPYKKSVK